MGNERQIRIRSTLAIRALKKIFAGLSLTALTVCGTQAQQANDDALAFKNSTKPKVEETTKFKHVIRQGTSGDVQRIARQNQALVLHISGGSLGEKYTPERYAQMLQRMFNDPKYAGENTTEISVLFEESDREGATLGFASIIGPKYDKNSGKYEDGDGIMHPTEIVKHIREITQQYKDAKIKALQTPIENDKPQPLPFP